MATDCVTPIVLVNDPLRLESVSRVGLGGDALIVQEREGLVPETVLVMEATVLVMVAADTERETVVDVNCPPIRKELGEERLTRATRRRGAIVVTSGCADRMAWL